MQFIPEEFLAKIFASSAANQILQLTCTISQNFTSILLLCCI